MTHLPSRSGQALVVSLRQLRRVAAVESASARLAPRAAAIGHDMVEVIVDGVEAFGDPASPKIRPLLERHAGDLVAEYLHLLGGSEVRPPVFVEDFACTVAEQYFPLEALLQAYRLGMRQLLDETLSALAPRGRDGVAVVTAATRFLLDFIDVASTLATEHYLERSRLLADVASDQRSELISILLGGYDESDRRVSTILRDAGYLDRRLHYCVALAQSVDPTEMHNPARARRLADSIERLLQPLPGERLIDLYRNKVTIVFSRQQRLSGWSAPREGLAARVARELLKVGPAARLGVSNDVGSAAMIPAAYRQAQLAFDVSSVGRRVVRFGDIPLQQLLLNFAQDEFSRILPAWADAFEAADARSGGRLSTTLRAYADNNMNLLETARQLGVHANTVYARFDRIRQLSDRDARRFDALNELLLVAACRGQGVSTGQV